MQISKHIHELRIPFRLVLGPNRTLERFVNVFIVLGKQVLLIDSAVSSSNARILDYMRQIGHEPGEISMLVITHAHPDHIGGAPGMKEATGCRVAAHAADVPWIEDVELQYRERPVPSFHLVVEGSLKVDVLLKDGDSLELGDGSSLRVIHAPGHSKGHIALLYEPEGALICADAVPIPGQMPIYEDVLATVRSVKRLRGIPGLKILLSSWDDTRYGDQIYRVMDEGVNYMQRIHDEVLRQKADIGSPDVEAVSARLVKYLGLPETALNPLFFKSIAAHLKAAHYEDLLRL